MEKKKSKKGIIIAAILFIALIVAFFAIYSGNKASGTQGSKNIKVIVADASGAETSYELATDQEFVKGALDELAKAQDFKYVGVDQTAGFMIQEINGKRAVYEEDGSYWSIYVNGEYAQYGIAEQPVKDGDTIKFAIEKMQ